MFFKKYCFFIILCLFPFSVHAETMAMKLNSEGMKFYENGNYKKALEKFDAACLYDFEYAASHYNSAEMRSLLAINDSSYRTEENSEQIAAHLLVSMVLVKNYRVCWKEDKNLRWFRSTEKGKYLLTDPINFHNKLEAVFLSTTTSDIEFRNFETDTMLTHKTFEGEGVYLIGEIKGSTPDKSYIGVSQGYPSLSTLKFNDVYLFCNKQNLPPGSRIFNPNGYEGVIYEGEDVNLYSQPKNKNLSNKKIKKVSVMIIIASFTDQENMIWFYTTFQGKFYWIKSADVLAGK